MKTIKKTLIACILVIITVSCGTTKSSVKAEVQDNEFALINGGSNTLTVSKKKYTEQVLIAKVDSLVVGSFYKDWPKNLKVKEGEHLIEVRHFRPWTYPKTDYYGGGAFGGAIVGAMTAKQIEKTLIHHHYLLRFKVEKNNSYLINFQSDSNDLENPKISILNVTTNTPINFEAKEKLINNK